MSQRKFTVEMDARARAAQTLVDGGPITDKALLIRCATAIEALKAALEEIAAQAGSRGAIWARQRAEKALDTQG